MSDISRFVEGAYVVDKLIGIPSKHYDPIFAQIATNAMAKFKPTVVALELPHSLLEELEWAASCWPCPVVSASQSKFFPFVPGDSIFEAFRAAKIAKIPVILVDLSTARPPVVSPEKCSDVKILGPELSHIRTGLFLEIFDILLAHTGPADPWDIAREAYMAQWIARLIAQGEKVMWVGGMAHWTRIVTRITEGDYDSPDVALTAHSDFHRMRIAPSALYRMTRRLPWLVAHYAEDQIGYKEYSALQGLCLEAAKESDQAPVLLISRGESKDNLTAVNENEDITPINVARTLQYARNLAAMVDLRVQPNFIELLTAAAATIGRKYTGRLYELAMNERFSEHFLEDEALEWDMVDGREAYRCGDRIIDLVPWWPCTGRILALLSIEEIHRRAQDELYKNLPTAAKGSKYRWKCSPDDEENYLSFVQYVLRRASLTDPEEVQSVPFRNGLRDGIDVRATLKNWNDGKIYVYEEQCGHLNFRNGAIDWSSVSEHSEILTGKKEGGWIDPDYTCLGSCSRTIKMEVLEKDPWIQQEYREFTLITLDAPTSFSTATPRETNKRPQTFYDHVILPLVEIKGTSKDNLYEWLDIMFEFCKGKPFAYYSRYVPSPEVHRIAWRHKVQVVHFPLHRLPANLLQRHKTFRFFYFTHKQWEEFQRRRTANTATWSG